MTGYATVTAAMMNYSDPVILIAGALILGFFLSCLLPMMHEAVHGNITGTPHGNLIWGCIAATPLLISFPVYRAYHISHHTYLGTPSDPEDPMQITGLSDYASFLSPRYFLLQFWKLSAMVTARHAPEWLSPRDTAKARQIWFFSCIPFAIALLALTVANPGEMACVYWAPLMLSGGWMFVTTLHEHFNPTTEGISTNSIRSRKLASFFLWNTNHHVAHHRASKLHFSQLRDREAALADSAALTSRENIWPSFTAYHLAVISKLVNSPAGRGVNQ
tara:strand:+ start:2403 stop:3227 length:825 start_codon:yes stop_codon:yes gene_type:complete